jgi:tripartite-type tricarboxylate transporter receptor subunit TctC
MELVALAKAKPGQLSYSSGGNGSAAHLAMEYFKLQTEIDILHVPYKGARHPQ